MFLHLSEGKYILKFLLNFCLKNIIMINQKMALFGAATALGVMGGAFVSPAQAINFSGTFSD